MSVFFAVNSLTTAEIFQYTLQTHLQGLCGVKYIANDILVYGKTRDKHDTNHEKCLQRLSTKGLRLNQSECTFLSNTLSFFGQIFSANGTKPNPQRVSSLQNAPTLTNVHDVRSLLGIPLRDLTKKNTEFEWTKEHQKAFDDLTAALSSAKFMAYFDTQKATYVTVDASPIGVSAILSQKSTEQNDEKVVA
ncbi:Hypothetical predicted protein, partial [Paramuricea clavata]